MSEARRWRVLAAGLLGRHVEDVPTNRRRDRAAGHRVALHAEPAAPLEQAAMPQSIT